MYALVSHSDGSSGPDGMPQPMRGPKAEDKDKEVAFVFTDIESSTELSNQDGDAFKQVCRSKVEGAASTVGPGVPPGASQATQTAALSLATTQPANHTCPVICLLPAAARGT
jgi:hypothetical protein